MESLVLITHGRICRVPWHSSGRVRRARRYSVAPEHAEWLVSNRSGAEALGRYHAKAHRRCCRRAMVWVGARHPNECGSGAAGIARSGCRFSLAAVGLVDWRISRVDIVPNLVLGDGDVLLYIHGFNQSFETAALDAARLADGLRFGGETVLFSWPSRNKLFDYIADRESATWSRDALEATLDSLVARPGLWTRQYCCSQHGRDVGNRRSAAGLCQAWGATDRQNWRHHSCCSRFGYGRILGFSRTDEAIGGPNYSDHVE